MERNISKRLRQVVLGSVVTLAIILMAAFTYDQYASQKAITNHPPSGEFLTIKGKKMHYLCQGQQEPTLVLLHGYAGGAIDWLPLMQELSKTQRVCAFDRLGSDYSDAPQSTQTALDSVNNIKSALEQLNISGPIIVGHSLGGALAQLYAATYPVKGVILVDGLSADIADEVTQRLGSYDNLRVFARLGLLRPIARSFVHPTYTGNLKKQMIALRSRSSAIVSFAQEGVAAKQGSSSETLYKAEQNMTAPLLIIAAGKTDVPEGNDFSLALEALANRYPKASYHRIEEASHYLIASHPKEVTVLIQNWLDTSSSGNTSFNTLLLHLISQDVSLTRFG